MEAKSSSAGSRFMNEDEKELLLDATIKVIDEVEAELSKLPDFEKRALVVDVVKAKLMNRGINENNAYASAVRITEKLQDRARRNIKMRQNFGDLRTNKKPDPARL